ncbi:6-phosphogluconolactonase [Acaryochloris sp. IP29b_bin.148]|uniref:6-phosphogluconolactonase n=1 Tax=Acaryochloris sp. IP29b_bin.148 TaxID=2969218 RepID=UPI00261706F2|nr:6-phosphogluconolactonase [Acaryochloris sp. IP29b_bin.148]
MKPQVEVFVDRPQLITRALELTVAEIKSAIAQRGRCTIALAGGNTPKPLYEQLATQDLPWQKIHVFWGDERYVPLSDPQSNAGMATAAWLNHVAIPPENIYPMPTQAADPAEAAQTYDRQLQTFFGTGPQEFPRFDIVLLGLGPDGHTASLFPHTEALQVCDRNVTVGSKDNQPRLTLTAPVLNQARCILFLVTGANKQDALTQIFAENADAAQFPARLIQPTHGTLSWLLDAEAGQPFQ